MILANRVLLTKCNMHDIIYVENKDMKRNLLKKIVKMF